MKSSRSPASGKRADRRVVWWTALLLVALGLVLTALFYSGRYVLSVDQQQIPSARCATRRVKRRSVARDFLLPLSNADVRRPSEASCRNGKCVRVAALLNGHSAELKSLCYSSAEICATSDRYGSAGVASPIGGQVYCFVCSPCPRGPKLKRYSCYSPSSNGQPNMVHSGPPFAASWGWPMARACIPSSSI